MASREHKRVPTSSKADLCQTPAYALTPLYPYLPKSWVIWESACGQGHLSRGLQDNGFEVVSTDIQQGFDFFAYEPIHFDAIITNPPFSCKLQFLERCYRLAKPFALLLPVEVLGVASIQRLFERYGIEVLFLSRRIGFATVNTPFEKSSAWFPVAWYTWGLGVDKQMTFVTVEKDSRQGRLF